jgi:hypothetical protein
MRRSPPGPRFRPRNLGHNHKRRGARAFRTTVRQREGRVRDKFAKGSGTYAEFFPQGLKEYDGERGRA